MRNTLLTLALLAVGALAVWLVMNATPDSASNLEFEAFASVTLDGNAEVLTSTPDGQNLLHTNRAFMALDVLDIAEPAQTQRIARVILPGKPEGVAISPDGQWAVAALHLAPAVAGQPAPHPRAPGGLAIIDIADPGSPQLTEIIGIGHQPASVAVASSGADLVAIVAVVNEPLTVTADNIVASEGELTDISRAGGVQVVTINPTRQSNYRVGAVDLSTARLTEAGLSQPDDAQPAFVALSADNSQAAAALPANQGIEVFDPYWLETRRLFGTPGQEPRAVAFSADGGTLFSAATLSDVNDGYSLSAWTTEGEFIWGERDLQEVSHIAVEKFGTTAFAFALSKSGSQFRVYDVSVPAMPQQVQTVQTTSPPQGLVLIPERGLAAVADGAGTLNFYKRAGTVLLPDPALGDSELK